MRISVERTILHIRDSRALWKRICLSGGWKLPCFVAPFLAVRIAVRRWGLALFCASLVSTTISTIFRNGGLRRILEIVTGALFRQTRMTAGDRRQVYAASCGVHHPFKQTGLRESGYRRASGAGCA
jgi:hypothetical protein